MGRRLNVRDAHPAWGVLALCFVVMLSAQGARMGFGAFVLPFEETFGATRASVSLISTVSFITYGLTLPIAGRLVAVIGARRVLALGVVVVAVGLLASSRAPNVAATAVAYGVLTSIGFGLASGTVAAVVVANWFVTRRGLAFALVEAGFGAGQLVFGPLSLGLVDVWGWRTTYLLFAALQVMVTLPLLWFGLRDTPQERNTVAYGTSESADAGAVEASGLGYGSRAFWFLAVPFFACGVTSTGIIDTHLVALAHHHGASDQLTALTVGVLATANIVGTILSGPLSDRYDPRMLLAALYGLRAVTFVLLLRNDAGPLLVVFGLLFGLVDFATVAPTQLLASQYFRPEQLGVVVGVLFGSHQLGSALGAWLPGEWFDAKGSYDGAVIASALTLIGAVAASLTLPRPPRVGVLAPTAVVSP